MQYNNIHYWVIAEIVAHLTKGTYPEYVKHHILDPLGMTSTYNHTEAGETGRRAESFVRAELNSTRCYEVWEQDDRLDRSCYGQPFPTSWFAKGNGLFVAGPGGLVASANDMVCPLIIRFDQTSRLR
jgi:CubicO group peptidase (beta-lactamase class C family)